MAMNPAQQLFKCGTSVWYDNISRELLQNGELKRMIEEWGVRGLTSNPTIFENALKNSNIYDSSIATLKASNPSAEQVFEELAIQDIAEAADLLRPIYDESEGVDGFVSIEVSPLLAADTKGTLEEAKRLNERLKRPNILIKVPGTPEGIPAVGTLLEEGINVNITLLFSVDNYISVAKTYCEALRARVEKGLPVDKMRSVASFFVSRVDSVMDKRLGEIIESSGGDSARADKARSLLGKFGIANSKIAYLCYKEIFEQDSFDDLRQKGALPQRPLWASTSTKNPDYRDVMYVESLIGPNTVNTMPHATLAATVDHAIVKETLLLEVEAAEAVAGELQALGIDVEKELADLQTEGVEKFSQSFASLIKTISEKLV